MGAELDLRDATGASEKAERELDELENELAYLREQVPKWRHVFHAPMDGRRLLLCWHNGLEHAWIYEVAPYSNLDVARRGEGFCHGKAQYFMPLPEPPEDAE